MNINPFAVQAPDSVEHTISNANATCIRFNRGRGLFAGHYMAAGRTDGIVMILNSETKALLRMFEGHVRAITTVSWSPYNRYLASGSMDWNVIIWDLQKDQRSHTLRFDAPVSRVHFSTKSCHLLVVVLQSQQCFLIDLRRRRIRQAVNGTFAVNGTANGQTSKLASKVGQREMMEERTELGLGDGLSGSFLSATFSADGETIVCGTSKGALPVFDVASKRLIEAFDGGSSGVREVAFDRLGRTLVTNSNDRAVRLFSYMVQGLGSDRPTASLTLLHRMQDLINRTPWFGIGFSGDGEYVFGGATHKAAHNIYIWDRGAGVLDKVLQGPRDSLIDVDWHPHRPMLASVSHTGAINVWFNMPTEIWSAYAPGFEELEENEIYQEREDEFDLEDEEEVTRRKQDEEEAHVDIFPHDQQSSDVSKQRKSVVDRMETDVSDAAEWEWATDDDDNSSFAIPVRLSLDLPDIDLED